MAVLDWVFLGVLAVSMLLGVWRGLVYEVLSLAAWGVAFFVAQWMAPTLAAWLPMSSAAESLRLAGGFGLAFVGAVFAGSLIAALVKKLMSAVGLAPVDRALGAAFGLVRGLVILLAATVVVAMTPLKGGVWWQESMGAGICSAALKGLKPVLPNEIGKYLP